MGVSVKKYSDFKIKTKLLIIYVLTCLVPILLLCFYFTSGLARFSSNYTMRLSYSGYDQLKANITKEIEKMNKYINEISNDIQLLNYLNTEFNNDYLALTDYLNIIEKRINYTTNAQVLIYLNNPTLGISRMTNNSIEEFKRDFGVSETTLGRINWSRVISSSTQQRIIGCYKSLRRFNKVSDENIIFSIQSDERTFYSLFEEAISPQKVFLVDNSMHIITSTERDLIFQPSEKINIDNNVSLKDIKSGDIITMGEIKYYTFFESLRDGVGAKYQSIPDWRLLYLIPYDSIQEDINKIWLYSLGIAVLCISLSFLAATRMSSNVTKRLFILVGKVVEVKKGNLNISAPVTSTDEIGILESGIYEMVAHIDKMMKDINQAHNKMLEQVRNNQVLQNEKKEAELMALRSQINPHYLFNTLETIRMNLVLKGDKETSHIVKIFADSFRSIIENNIEKYTLNDEIIFVTNYLKIQKYRFKEKLDYEINIQEELAQYRIPKLFIQPLIENALYHGIEKKMEPGKIIISVEMNCGNIHIRVSDNGPGIAAELLDDITSKLTDLQYRGSKYMALRNISNRMRLLYGDLAKMSIESVHETGTVIDIYFPERGGEYYSKDIDS
jgi:two-component system, sensor histidine kinase YesM